MHYFDTVLSARAGSVTLEPKAKSHASMVKEDGWVNIRERAFYVSGCVNRRVFIFAFGDSLMFYC